MTRRQPTLRPRYRYVSVALAIMAVVGMASRADAHGERESLTTPADFGDRVLARVNDVVITGHDLRHAFEMLPPETQAAMRLDVKKFLDVLIQREVLYREALRAVRPLRLPASGAPDVRHQGAAVGLGGFPGTARGNLSTREVRGTPH